jgi:KTSC domain
MKIRLALFLLPIIAASCHSYTCEDLPDAFTSIEDGIQRVKASTYHFTDSLTLSDTSLAYTYEVDSWIVSANYYSCDGEKGYLIFHVSRGTNYIRKDIPIKLWNGLKKAPAKGPYYDSYIKNKFSGINLASEINYQISN